MQTELGSANRFTSFNYLWKHPCFRSIVCTFAFYGYGMQGIQSIKTLQIMLVLFLMYMLFRNADMHENIKRKESKIIAVNFSMFMCISKDWIGKSLEQNFLSGLLLFAALCCGSYWIAQAFLDFLYGILLARKENKKYEAKTKEKIEVFLFSFFLLWITYFVYYLNQYPGTLTPDFRAQIGQILGTQPYDNENPFIATLFIGLWIKLGMWIFGTTNAGLGFYSLVQLTLAAMICAYTVSSIYNNSSKFLSIAAHVFFNCMPYNIAYSSGMQKDTLFALCFLATITYIWNFLCEEKQTKLKLLIAFFLVLTTSLLRNSGWSAMLVLGIAMFSVRKNESYGRLCRVIIGGALTSIGIVALVLPTLGVTDNGSIVVGLSTPIQQISRVIACGVELEEEDEFLIREVITFDYVEFPERYSEITSDPIKFRLKADILKANLKDYFRLWLKLGVEYPKVYLDAWAGLMRGYWDLDYRCWLWDARIWENDFGIHHDRKLIPRKNLSDDLQLMLRRIPYATVIQNTAIVLWTIIIAFGYARITNNVIGKLLCVPLLMIYIGLLLTCPTMNFRYTYAAVLCLPIVLVIFSSKQLPAMFTK